MVEVIPEEVPPLKVKPCGDYKDVLAAKARVFTNNYHGCTLNVRCSRLRNDLHQSTPVTLKLRDQDGKVTPSEGEESEVTAGLPYGQTDLGVLASFHISKKIYDGDLIAEMHFQVTPNIFADKVPRGEAPTDTTPPVAPRQAPAQPIAANQHPLSGS
jgi:hypothetical protein